MSPSLPKLTAQADRLWLRFYMYRIGLDEYRADTDALDELQKIINELRWTIQDIKTYERQKR